MHKSVYSKGVHGVRLKATGNTHGLKIQRAYMKLCFTDCAVRYCVGYSDGRSLSYERPTYLIAECFDVRSRHHHTRSPTSVPHVRRYAAGDVGSSG